MVSVSKWIWLQLTKYFLGVAGKQGARKCYREFNSFMSHGHGSGSGTEPWGTSLHSFASFVVQFHKESFIGGVPKDPVNNLLDIHRRELCQERPVADRFGIYLEVKVENFLPVSPIKISSHFTENRQKIVKARSPGF